MRFSEIFFFWFEVKIFRNRTALTKSYYEARTFRLLSCIPGKKMWLSSSSVKGGLPALPKMCRNCWLEIFPFLSEIKNQNVSWPSSMKGKSWFDRILCPYTPDGFYRWILSFSGIWQRSTRSSRHFTLIRVQLVSVSDHSGAKHLFTLHCFSYTGIIHYFDVLGVKKHISWRIHLSKPSGQMFKHKTNVRVTPGG